MIRNSTISVKKKNCISCGKLSYIFSKKRCADCSRIEDSNKRLEKETNRLIQQEDLSELIEQADTVFSKYVRMSAANAKGEVSCYTCGDRYHYSQLDCGHFISRSHLYLRWDTRNAKAQCISCNRHGYGNMAEYTKRLNRDFPGLPDILREESTIVYKPTREELKQLIAEYSLKVKQLKNNLK